MKSEHGLLSVAHKGTINRYVKKGENLLHQTMLESVMKSHCLAVRMFLLGIPVATPTAKKLTLPKTACIGIVALRLLIGLTMSIEATTMKTLLLILCLISLSTSLWAQLSDAIFPVRPENIRYLRYDYYDNVFDSAMVSLVFGEIRVNSSAGSMKIPLTFSSEERIHKGDTIPGRDNVLAAKGTSKSFVMPGGAVTVNFYRELAALSIPCSPNGSSSTGGAPGMDRHWNIGVGKIVERTEFLLELVRASDGSVIATVDSVGVMTNPTTAIVPRYGTVPDLMNHQRSLPTGYSGETLFFRIVPVRFVYSYPLRMRQISSEFNYSCVREYDSTAYDIIKLNRQELDSLDEMFWQEIQYYYDSVKAATGHLPDLLVETPPLGKDSIYFARYFYIDSTVNGRTYLREKIDNIPFSKTSVNSNEMEVSTNGITMDILPNPAVGHRYKISLSSPKSILNSSLTLYSSNGEEIIKASQLKINKGKNILTPFPQLRRPGGVYFMVLRDSDNHILARKSFIVE